RRRSSAAWWRRRGCAGTERAALRSRDVLAWWSSVSRSSICFSLDPWWQARGGWRAAASLTVSSTPDKQNLLLFLWSRKTGDHIRRDPENALAGGLTPTPTPETAPFWAAAAAGRLSIQRCRTCG